jgi:cobalt-zinc-cadmium efflux system outer membrane protein
MTSTGGEIAPANSLMSLTVEQAVSLALTNNPELLASTGRIDAASGRAYQARRWRNPELSLATEDIPLRSGSFRDSKDTIGLTQTVPYPGKKRLDGQIGAAEVRSSRADWQLRRQELARDVKIAYFHVLAADRLVQVGRELVQVASASATTARKRVEAGAAADQEQLRAEIQMSQAQDELASFEKELAAARLEFATLLGRPDLKDASLASALTETPDNALLERGPEQWLARHPGTMAARIARDRAELELRRARLEPYPDVTVGVSGGRESANDNSIVEFRLGVPLPIFDRSKGQKQEARARVDIALAELTATEQRLLRDWRIASQRFRTAARQVALYRDQILPKADAALKLVQTGFQEGRFGFMDLIDTQRTTAESRQTYQQKLLELNVAQAELQALVDIQPDSSAHND